MPLITSTSAFKIRPMPQRQLVALRVVLRRELRTMALAEWDSLTVTFRQRTIRAVELFNSPVESTFNPLCWERERGVRAPQLHPTMSRLRLGLCLKQSLIQMKDFCR